MKKKYLCWKEKNKESSNRLKKEEIFFSCFQYTLPPPSSSPRWFEYIYNIIHGFRFRNDVCLQISHEDKSLLASYGLPNPFFPFKIITLTLISLVKGRPLNTKEILWFLSIFIYRLSAKDGRQTADYTSDRHLSKKIT